MSYSSFAIIGTAGRGNDKALLTHRHYDRMLQGATMLMSHTGIDPKTIKGISGGAAWADHLIVTLGVLGGIDCSNITLYLPCELDEHGYYLRGDHQHKTASTANYYHKIFSEKIGVNTLGQIREIRERGATIVNGNGNFHARNALVAKHVSDHGLLLAYTVGDADSDQLPWTMRRFEASCSAGEAGLKDGGTAHTFNHSKCEKYHARIGEM